MYDKIKEHLSDRFVEDVLMKEITSFKTGGKVRAIAYPNSVEELRMILEYASSANEEYLVIGNCSNIIVTDGGYDGLIISTTKLKSIAIDGNIITAHCGDTMREVSSFALKNSLTGAEFLGGIPGTMGGGIFMNAGAYNCELKDIVTEVKSMTREGEVIARSLEEVDFSYRHSIYNNNTEIILNTSIRLENGIYDEIKESMRVFSSKRRNSQPLEYPSAGSTFKRPLNAYAAKLIDDAGLKGARVGGAMVSTKHAGFIINYENATSTDILNLIEHIKEVVYNKFDIMLETEVKIIGR